MTRSEPSAGDEPAYFQAIEEFFVSRRGDPLFLSSADWTLVHAWRTQGVPLRVVMRGIGDALDGHAHSWGRGRKVASLRYCAPAVEDGGAGRIRLNRPKAIHALNLGMCDAINAALARWREDAAVQVLMIDHAEGRGFCAGGDVLALHRSGTSDGVEARASFHSEYRINHTLFTYARPTIAFMDGVVMGGGVGISQPCLYRIATENTRFAMPEGTIGLFPDVGGGWYLARLPGQIGKYLALTAARIDGADCRAIGLATHYIPTEKLEEVKARIAASPTDAKAILDAAEVVPPISSLVGHQAEIDRVFVAETLEGVHRSKLPL